MKKIASLIFACICIVSCSEDKDDNLTASANITIQFTHNWDGTPVTNSDFNTIQYTNANGESMSIEKLRYLISAVSFEKADGQVFEIDAYNLVDVTSNSNLSYTILEQIPTDTYSNVSFTFGFNNDDNYQNYTDLNAASWNVPGMLGGGYHFMQLEGKFIDNNSLETGYAYHTIRAVDISGAELKFEDTFFTVNLGEINVSNETTIEVKMNIAEWFKNPNQWDLNILTNTLMPNFGAQIMMRDNGRSAFSLGVITQ